MRKNVEIRINILLCKKIFDRKYVFRHVSFMALCLKMPEKRVEAWHA